LNTSGDEFNVSGSLNCQKDGWLGRQILPGYLCPCQNT
jgi:hypothetical protein